MRIDRRLLLVAFFAMVIASIKSGPVFAESQVSLSITPELIDLRLMSKGFTEESQTITASTSSLAGYTIGIETNGQTSALVNTQNSSYTVPTFTLPSGATSIPVGQLGYGYGYSLDGGDNYYPVPEPSLTTPTVLYKTTSAGEHDHELTFGANVPMEIARGEYINTFTITIVANFGSCSANRICYYGNGDDGTGTMDDQVVQYNSTVDLIPSNFSKPNYGFAGWNTSMDGTGTDYGPGETIDVGDVRQQGLQLYAKWVPSAGDLQTWDGCSTMNSGDVTALTDTRDGNTYAVAKLPDGRCWMMENLRLDLSNPNLVISKTNTNRPKDDFITQVNQHPASSNSFCEGTNAACIDRLNFNTNNINRNLAASYNTNNNSSSWYSYGVDYNWYTATAGHGSFSFSTKGAVAGGDLCPKNWHLPSGYDINGELSRLDIALGGDGKNKTANPEVSERWRRYPVNYIYSGEYRGNSSYNRGISAGLASSNTYSSTNAINLWIRAAGVNMNGNSTSKNRGQTVRCVMNERRSVTGNIHYDANGGTGTMTDDTDVEFDVATAKPNSFTKTDDRFVSWNTKADGSGTTVADGGAVAAAASNEGIIEGGTLNLYAIWQPAFTVTYNGNGSTAGAMNTVYPLTGNSLTLTAPNYSKTGYGFAGWSLDSDAATKLLSGNNVTIYGPNQKIQTNSSFTAHANANQNIELYAVWIQADQTKTMQTFNTSDCAALTAGQIIALTDIRNSEVYSVAKLSDGHCWMLENLKLNPATVQFSTQNTNAPTADFITQAGSSNSSRTLCGTDNAACDDQLQYNLDNIDRSLPASEKALNPGYSWYGYGGLYNWYTATAGNGDFAMASGSTTGDICPNGWRLPTGGSSGEFGALNTAIGGNSKNDEALRRYPNNFIYSGDFNQTAPGGRNTYGRYWSSTAENANKAFRMGFTSSNVTPANSWNKWDAFAIRCIVQ